VAFPGNFRLLDPYHRSAVVILGTFGALGFRVLYQHADHVRHGAELSAASGRRHRVVENVERIMARGRTSPKAATPSPWNRSLAPHRIGLVLAAVFAPWRFFPLHRRHLSPVFRDIVGHAAVGRRGPDPDAGSLCIASQAGASWS